MKLGTRFVVLGVSTLVSVAGFTGSADAAIYTGRIKVTDQASGTDLGYLGKAGAWSGNHVYGVSDLANSLEITFDGGAVFPITIIGGNASLPYLGAIVGPSSTSNDLGASSYNYVFLGDTSLTPVGSAPVSGPSSFSSTLPFESSIWSLNETTNELTMNWVNTNGSTPAATAMNAAGPGFTTWTGDVATYQSAFGSSRVPVVYTFVGVPEPTTSALAVLGLGAAGLIRRRRQTSAV